MITIKILVVLLATFDTYVNCNTSNNNSILVNGESNLILILRSQDDSNLKVCDNSTETCSTNSSNFQWIKEAVDVVEEAFLNATDIKPYIIGLWNDINCRKEFDTTCESNLNSVKQVIKLLKGPILIIDVQIKEFANYSIKMGYSNLNYDSSNDNTSLNSLLHRTKLSFHSIMCGEHGLKSFLVKNKAITFKEIIDCLNFNGSSSSNNYLLKYLTTEFECNRCADGLEIKISKQVMDNSKDHLMMLFKAITNFVNHYNYSSTNNCMRCLKLSSTRSPTTMGIKTEISTLSHIEKGQVIFQPTTTKKEIYKTKMISALKNSKIVSTSTIFQTSTTLLKTTIATVSTPATKKPPTSSHMKTSTVKYNVLDKSTIWNDVLNLNESLLDQNKWSFDDDTTTDLTTNSSSINDTLDIPPSWTDSNFTIPRLATYNYSNALLIMVMLLILIMV